MVIPNLKFSMGRGAFWSEILERGFLENLDKNLLFNQKPACASHTTYVETNKLVPPTLFGVSCHETCYAIKHWASFWNHVILLRTPRANPHRLLQTHAQKDSYIRLILTAREPILWMGFNSPYLYHSSLLCL